MGNRGERRARTRKKLLGRKKMTRDFGLKDGELWGNQMVRLTTEQLRALGDGRQLAIQILDEYLLFLEGPGEAEGLSGGR